MTLPPATVSVTAAAASRSIPAALKGALGVAILLLVLLPFVWPLRLISGRSGSRKGQRFLSIVSLTALVLATSSISAIAAQGPKHKDTRDFLKPKEVTYKTSVTPAQAKPGDKVTYSVEVSVQAPWHIYAYAAKQPKAGPRNTQFDLFDPAGLKPASTWTPDRKPIRKKEPAFPNLEAVELYEKTVTWSTTLTVPENAAPGKKSIQAQIYFQICNESSCKPPSYVTLPPATVSVTSAAAMLPDRRDLAGVCWWASLKQPQPQPSHHGSPSRPAGTRERDAGEDRKRFAALSPVRRAQRSAGGDDALCLAHDPDHRQLLRQAKPRQGR